VRRLTKYF